MTYDMGSKAAGTAANKFRQGLLIKSKKIMVIGVQMMIESIRSSLHSEEIFETLSGLSEFWNFVTATEMTSEKLRTLPKEFHSVLSSKKMFSAKKGKIPSDLKEILHELKEIIHVGELLRGKSIENREGFVERSEEVLKKCEKRLKKII